MSLAIKFGNTNDNTSLSGFIYFDAVTNYSKSLSGKPTSHPLDAGASITDHWVANNPRFTIQGVITSADLAGIPQQFLDEDERPFNLNAQTVPVEINEPSSGALQFVLNTFSQFFPMQLPSAVVSEQERTDYREQVWSLIEKIMTDLVYDQASKKLKNRITPITLYEYSYGKLSKENENLVITDFSVEETADTGDGMYINVTFEKVRFVTLEKVELPKDVSDQLKKAAAPKAKKAKANSTEQKMSATNPPANQPKGDADLTLARAANTSQQTIDRLKAQASGSR